jgi:hypothetical protein
MSANSLKALRISRHGSGLAASAWVMRWKGCGAVRRIKLPRNTAPWVFHGAVHPHELAGKDWRLIK